MTNGPNLVELISQYTQLRETYSETRRYPPVEQWNPPECGDIGMEIRKDGSWWHEGARITRQPLIDLFATVLRKDEDGRTWLVTPGEKVIVHVQDAHFLGMSVQQMLSGGKPSILVETNVGQHAILGPDNPLRVETDPETGEPRPYVTIRGRLEARILRAPFYELVNWGVANGDALEITSQGMTFSLGSLEGQTA